MIRPSYPRLIWPYCYFQDQVSGLQLGHRVGYEGCALNPISQLGCSTVRSTNAVPVVAVHPFLDSFDGKKTGQVARTIGLDVEAHRIKEYTRCI
jgi:hypothetical protein